jgi:phytoene synthase
MTLSEARRACAAITREQAGSFYYGLRLLPAAKRHALYAVYAWSRAADDAVDDFVGDEARVRLDAARALITEAISPEYETSKHAVAVALGDAVRRYRLPAGPFWALLEGMEMDLEGRRYQTFSELLEYCRSVAGTVGELSVRVFGFEDPAALERSQDLALALQLTNILRDLSEDLERGRVYLPLTEMADAGYSLDDLQARRRGDAFLAVCSRQADRAEALFASARPLVELVDADARRCLMALSAVYEETLRRIRASGFNLFGPRIRVPRSAQLKLLAGVVRGRASVPARLR